MNLTQTTRLESNSASQTPGYYWDYLSRGATQCFAFSLTHTDLSQILIQQESASFRMRQNTLKRRVKLWLFFNPPLLCIFWVWFSPFQAKHDMQSCRHEVHSDGKYTFKASSNLFLRHIMMYSSSLLFCVIISLDLPDQLTRLQSAMLRWKIDKGMT